MKKILITLIIVLLCVGLLSIRSGEKRLQIYMLDVGQGDSILIISPDNKKLLVDTGKNDSAVENLRSLLSPFDMTIDYVLITHPDSDHKGGYEYVQDYYSIEKTIENATENSDFMLGCCVVIDFVWPLNNTKSKETNENSSAFFITYNEFSGFFDGDLPSELEDIVIAKNPRDVDLVKISHHGSSSSTDNFFLSVLKPEVALISVGKNNSYHHPSSKTLYNLNRAGAKVYRTDELGTIHLSTDGYQLVYTLNN